MDVHVIYLCSEHLPTVTIDYISEIEEYILIFTKTYFTLILMLFYESMSENYRMTINRRLLKYLFYYANNVINYLLKQFY